MTITTWLILLFWLVFLVYWIASAVKAKRRAQGSLRPRGAMVRVVLIIAVLLIQQSHEFRRLSGAVRAHAVFLQPGLGILGVVLCGCGIAYAIYARRHIGRNWGMPMSLQQGHELVTSGPYARVRHPIYTGILLATLGTSLAEGPVWFLLFVIFFIYFTWSAKVEEGTMTQQFPEAYPPYQRRTKMLVPFVW